MVSAWLRAAHPLRAAQGGVSCRSATSRGHAPGAPLGEQYPSWCSRWRPAYIWCWRPDGSRGSACVGPFRSAGKLPNGRPSPWPTTVQSRCLFGRSGRPQHPRCADQCRCDAHVEGMAGRQRLPVRIVEDRLTRIGDPLVAPREVQQHDRDPQRRQLPRERQAVGQLVVAVAVAPCVRCREPPRFEHLAESFSTECPSLSTLLAVIGQIEVMRCFTARTWVPRKAGRG